MVRPFIVNDEVVKKCADLRATAEAHPISLEKMQRLAARAQKGDKEPDPQMGLQTIYLPFGYAITFTIETAMTGIQVRHFSMTVDDLVKLPNPMAVDMILPHFGWIGGLENAYPMVTDLPDGRKCIELLQPVSGVMSEIMVKDPA